jgi:hypothetical protein
VADRTDDAHGLFDRLIDRLEQVLHGPRAQQSNSGANAANAQSPFGAAMASAYKQVMDQMAATPASTRNNVKFNTVKFRFNDPLQVGDDPNVQATEAWAHIDNPRGQKRQAGFSNFANMREGTASGEAARALYNFAPAPVAAGFASALQKSRGWSDLDDSLQRMARRIKDEGGSTFGISIARGAVGMAGTGSVAIFAAVEGIKYFADKIDRSYQFQAQAIAPFNGTMMMANASLKLGDFDRARRMGLAVSGSFSEMTDALNVFRERTQPIKEALTNLGNRVGTAGLGFAGAALDHFWNKGLPNPFHHLPVVGGNFDPRIGPGKDMAMPGAGMMERFASNPKMATAFAAGDALFWMAGAIGGMSGWNDNMREKMGEQAKGWLGGWLPKLDPNGKNRAKFEAQQAAIERFLHTQKERLSPGAYSAGLAGGMMGRMGENSRGAIGDSGFFAGFDDKATAFAAEEVKAKERMGEMWNDIRAMAGGQVGMKNPLNPMLGEGVGLVGGALGAAAFMGAPAGGGGVGATAGNAHGVSPAQMAAFRRRDPRIGADGRWRPTPGSDLANSNTVGPRGLPVGRDGRPRRNIGLIKDDAMDMVGPGAGGARRAAMVAPERVQDPDEQVGPRMWGANGPQPGSRGIF